VAAVFSGLDSIQSFTIIITCPYQQQKQSQRCLSSSRLFLESINKNCEDASDHNDGNDDTPDHSNSESDKEFHQQLQSRHEDLQVERTRSALEAEHRF
jgi:hypothetical protein